MTSQADELLPVTRGHWITMACPICGAERGKPCVDTMGHRHPSSHPERRVWSTFDPRHLQERIAELEAAVERIVAEVSGRFPNWKPTDAQLGFARACVKAALSAAPDAGLGELLREARGHIAELDGDHRAYGYAKSAERTGDLLTRIDAALARLDTGRDG